MEKEFELIEKIEAKVKDQYNSEVLKGIGDDCAVLEYSSKEYLLLATDTLNEGIHFLRDTDFFALGYKSVAVNLSDIAAMGGYPLAILVSLSIPKKFKTESLKELYKGIIDISKKYGTAVVGGDTTESLKNLSISIAIYGRVSKEKISYRNGAKKGDIIFVTGYLGDSNAGLNILLDKKEKLSIDESYLLKRHLKPEPSNKEIAFLNSLVKINALNDISDGLASELSEIAEASKKSLHIDLTKIPISKQLAIFFKNEPSEALNSALFGGEDFELVGTMKESDFFYVKDLYKERFSKSLVAIGRVEDGEGVFLKDSSGCKKLEQKGYEHIF